MPRTVNECPSLDQQPDTNGLEEGTIERWANLDSDTSVTVDAAANGETRGLCVVRTWEDERKIRQFGDVSVAWASTPPLSELTDNPQKRESDTARSTTSITWDYSIDEGFTYILRLLSTSRDGDPPSDIADCSGGDPVASPSAANRENFSTSYRHSSPDPYAHYALCIQAENDTGASDWAFVGGTAETRPAAPSAPSYDSGESEVETEAYGGAKVTRLVWSVAQNAGTPQDGDLYGVTVFRSNERSVPRGQIQNVCDNPVTTFGGAPLNTGLKQTNTNTGVEIEVSGDLVTIALTPDEYYVYACVRADPTPEADNDGNHGGWSISAPQKFVAGQRDLSAPNTPSTVLDTAGQVKWTWVRVDADGYQVQYAVDRTDVRNHDPTATVNQVASGATPEYVLRRAAGTIVALRVRSYQTVGGTKLYSEWSDATDATVPASLQ